VSVPTWAEFAPIREEPRYREMLRVIGLRPDPGWLTGGSSRR
jgi:hypothetical protein